MDEHSGSSRVAGRLGGLLLIGCAALTAATLPLPHVAGSDRPAVLALSLVAMALGSAAVVLPWQRWPSRATLVLLPIAFALISAGNYYANAQPYTYSVFFIVAFVWLGLSHRRWTSLWFLPLAAAAYDAPLLLRHEPAWLAASAALVIPVCALVAESIAWIGARERRTRERSAGLVRVALSLGPHLDVDGLGGTLAQEVRVMLAAEHGIFLLVDDRAVSSVFTAGFTPAQTEQLAALVGSPLGDSRGMHDLEAGRPVVVEDAKVGSPLIDDPDRFGLRSYLAVPVVVEDELGGILACTEHTRARRYRVDDVRSAQALAAQAGAALRNALLYERTLEAANCDYLTGLGNRRAFHERLETEVERAHRHGRTLSILVLDVDHLKQFNDAGGHIAGDDVLDRIGRLLRKGSRREDGVYRIGGDEFALMLPETGPDEASVVAERIRRDIERSGLSGASARDLTISVGISSFPEHGITADELFERADTALYEVKRAGRNAISSATSGGSPGVRFGVDVPAVIEASLLSASYQPIVNIGTRDVIGWEAFCRVEPGHGTAPMPTLFRAAAALGLSAELDRCCRRVAIGGATELDDGALLFVNVSPAALTGRFDVAELCASVSDAGLRPGQVVLEVTEHDRVPAPAFVHNLLACRTEGFRLALDDFGGAAADLDVVGSLPFDFVKIDARALRGDGERRRPVVLGLLLVAREVGARLVAAGVETAEELALMDELGFDAAQGYYLQHPLPRLAVSH